MGIAKKTDGRYVVGVGVDNANDYRGSAAYRDIYIQLTSSGATAKSEEYLTFLKDYGFHANSLGEPIMPPSVNVWISNNGVTTAVEADDVSIDGSNYTICGIKWNGSAWDYSGAGQGKSGSGLPPYSSADIGKFLAIGEGGSALQTVIPEQTVTIEFSGGQGVYIFPDNAGVNKAFFQNAQEGDVCTIVIDDTEVESTATNVYGMLLFPAGDYYIGNAVEFGGVGVAKLDGSGEVTIKIKASAVAPLPTAIYENTPFVVTLDDTSTPPSIDKTYTEIMKAYQAGKPVFLKRPNTQVPIAYGWLRLLTGTNAFNGTYMSIAYNTQLQKSALFIDEVNIASDDTVTIANNFFIPMESVTSGGA